MVINQPVHDVRTMLYGRCYDVKTFKRRPYNIILTSYVGWVLFVHCIFLFWCVCQRVWLVDTFCKSLYACVFFCLVLMRHHTTAKPKWAKPGKRKVGADPVYILTLRECALVSYLIFPYLPCFLIYILYLNLFFFLLKILFQNSLITYTRWHRGHFGQL